MDTSNNNKVIVFPELVNTALIRELHVYGDVLNVSHKNNLAKSAQHLGFGKQLLQKAFEIAYFMVMLELLLFLEKGLKIIIENLVLK